MKRVVRVSLSGTDCSGKSTQAALLASALEARGIRVSQRWYRPGYSRFLNSLRALARSTSGNLLPGEGEPEKRAAMFARPSVRRAWATIALLDALWQFAVIDRVLRLRRIVVIRDRGVFDALLDLDFRFPDLDIKSGWLAGLLGSSEHRHTVRVMLIAPWSTIRARAAQKQEPFPDPPETRWRRYLAYETAARESTWSVVDAGQSMEAVHDQLLAPVLHSISGRNVGTRP